MLHLVSLTSVLRSQVWSAAEGWKPIYGCAVAPMLTADNDKGKRDAHGKLFAWSGDTVFQVGQG